MNGAKIKVKSIEFGYSENRMANHYLVGKVFKSWKDANVMIGRCASSAPGPEGGYDKTDFKVTFEDGEVYEGRLDMKKNMCGGHGVLQVHITDFLRFHAGFWKPAHMTKEQYDAYLERQGEYGELRENAKTFLAKYDLEVEA